jgi:hypothetical protein
MWYFYDKYVYQNNIFRIYLACINGGEQKKSKDDRQSNDDKLQSANLYHKRSKRNLNKKCHKIVDYEFFIYKFCVE